MHTFLQFYHPQAIYPDRSTTCPDFLYQPYTFTYSSSYVCEYNVLVLLNATYSEDFLATKPLVFYIFTVIVFLVLPIIFNIAISFKVLFEVRLSIWMLDCSLLNEKTLLILIIIILLDSMNNLIIGYNAPLIILCVINHIN